MEHRVNKLGFRAARRLFQVEAALTDRSSALVVTLSRRVNSGRRGEGEGDEIECGGGPVEDGVAEGVRMIG